MTKRSIGQSIVIGMMPLFLLLASPTTIAADKSAAVNDAAATVKKAPAMPAATDTDTNASKKSDKTSTQSTSSDATSNMKQQPAHSENKDMTDSDKMNKEKDAKAKTKANKATTGTQKQ